MAWTDDRVEQLKTLWAEGLSAAQIANKMGGVTRNAVIGKVHRLGLSGRATPAKPQRGRVTMDRKEGAAIAKAPAPDLKPVIPEPAFIPPALLDTGDLMTVATIKNNMCKWPIGDPATDAFHFCGQSTLSGKSYCGHHANLAFQPPQRRTERRPDPRRLLPKREKQRAAG